MKISRLVIEFKSNPVIDKLTVTASDVLENVSGEVLSDNHDGYGRTTIDGINFINCATCDEDYQAVNKPIYFELPVK